MKIHLRDIREEESEYLFTEKDPWILQTIEAVDEIPSYRPASVKLHSKSKARPISVAMRIMEVDGVIVISGNVKAQVELLCSRCASPFLYDLEPPFKALLSQDPILAGAEETHATIGHQGSSASPFAEDLDISHVKEDHINLADILAEQVALKMPFQPLCKADCKGVCPTCGSDLNQGRCACKKVESNTPFSILRDYQLKPSKNDSKKSR